MPVRVAEGEDFPSLCQGVHVVELHDIRGLKVLQILVCLDIAVKLVACDRHLHSS